MLLPLAPLAVHAPTREARAARGGPVDPSPEPERSPAAPPPIHTFLPSSLRAAGCDLGPESGVVCPSSGALGPGAARNGSGWVNITPSVLGRFPPAVDGGLVYDPTSGYDVDFLGTNPYGGYLTETYSNGTWSGAGGSSALVARAFPSFAWDPATGTDILFGGESPGPPALALNDTWSFSGGRWAELTPTHAPAPRYGASLAWDPTDNELVLFGGNNGSASLADTWAFTNWSWVNVTGTFAPPARWGGAMVGDLADREIVLFGGLNASGTVLGDTWTYARGQWAQLNPAESPPARTQASYTYDPALGSFLLFGGNRTSSLAPGAAWTFSGGQWNSTATSPQPSARVFGQMAPDPAGQDVLMLGGYGGPGVGWFNDSWEYYTLRVTATATPPYGEGPLNVSLVGGEIGGQAPLSYHWSLGDGGSATGPIVNRSYPSPGVYPIQLTGTDVYGVQGSYSFDLIERAPIEEGATATPLLGIAPFVVHTTVIAAVGEPPYTFHWASSAGPAVEGANGSITFPLPGVYDLEAWANDSWGYSRNQSFIVTALSPPPLPALNVSIAANQTTGDAPLLVQFHAGVAGGGGGYHSYWEFGNGATSTSSAPSAVYDAPGDYRASVVVAAPGGPTGNAELPISVVPGLSIQVGYTESVSATGASVLFTCNASGGVPPDRFLWQFGDGEGADVADPVHVFSATGTYLAHVQVLDARGDIAVQSLNLTVHVPAATASPPPSVLTAVGTAIAPLLLAGTFGLIAGAGIVWMFHRRLSPRPPGGPPSARVQGLTPVRSGPGPRGPRARGSSGPPTRPTGPGSPRGESRLGPRRPDS
ncbi:MAG: PKD domain-containing protein [Thermoplasmata archaeon]|nr:PKD domain-containing protein [Thermoplasmata archaeon]